MRFTKMHGIGNDYVYVNCFAETMEDPAGVAIRVSDRHFGIGADGLILIKPSENADFEMEMYNADGSLGAMCGNGIRCVAKYVYDHGLTDRTQIRVATGSGIKTLDLMVEDGKVSLVRVDMGAPGLRAADVPVMTELAEGVEAEAGEAEAGEAVKTAEAPGTEKMSCAAESDREAGKVGAAESDREAGRVGAAESDREAGRVGVAESNRTAERFGMAESEKAETAGIADAAIKTVNSVDDGCGSAEVVGVPIVVNGQTYEMTCVSMGNPHCIVCVDDVDGLKIENVGPYFEHHPCFPDRVNTEFIRVLDRRTVQMRVWERGSGETWACGTGACAVAVACIVNGWTEDEITVKLRGGDLKIQWDRKKNTVFMTGPATTVFDGEIIL